MTKIIIADDHQLIIEGIKSLMANESDIQIIADVSNGKLLLECDLLTEVDLVLMDIGMPVMDGLETTKSLKKSHPNLKVLVLTTYADQRSIKQMLKLGVDGYVLKDSGKASFLDAIETIMGGGTYYDKRVTDVMMQSFNKKSNATPTPLTEREKDVIRLIAEGMSTNEIAEKLFLSALTVETHRKNIFTKLGMKKVASLVRYAIEEGLVD